MVQDSQARAEVQALPHRYVHRLEILLLAEDLAGYSYEVMKLQFLLSLVCVVGATDPMALNSREQLSGQSVEEQNSGLGMLPIDIQKTSVSRVEDWVVGYRRSTGYVQKPFSVVDKRSANNVQRSPRKRRSPGPGGERDIKHQIRQLKKMKCKPQRTKMYVADLLEETNELKFELLMPQVLAVRRCIPSCSYCGDMYGLERSKCLSIKHKMKAFTIRHLDDQGKWQYFKLPIRVDRKCQCQ